MSLRLTLVTLILRHVAKPRLSRTRTPELAAAEFERVAGLVFRPPRGAVRTIDHGGPVPMHRLCMEPGAEGKAVLYLHGGAYLSGSGKTHGPMLARLAQLSGVAHCAPDYRLSTVAAFPAAFDDAVAAWRHLRGQGHRPEDIVLGGDSAGAGLALALLAHLCASGERPAGLFALCPWTDLTLSGASLARNGLRDPVLPVERMAEAVDLYLAGAPADDPRASPLFAAFADPPPVLIHVGAEEALLDDSLRMAERLGAAGGTVTLQTWAGVRMYGILVMAGIPKRARR